MKIKLKSLALAALVLAGIGCQSVNAMQEFKNQTLDLDEYNIVSSLDENNNRDSLDLMQECLQRMQQQLQILKQSDEFRKLACSSQMQQYFQDIRGLELKLLNEGDEEGMQRYIDEIRELFGDVDGNDELVNNEPSSIDYLINKFSEGLSSLEDFMREFCANGIAYN